MQKLTYEDWVWLATAVIAIALIIISVIAVADVVKVLPETWQVLPGETKTVNDVTVSVDKAGITTVTASPAQTSNAVEIVKATTITEPPAPGMVYHVAKGTQFSFNCKNDPSFISTIQDDGSLRIVIQETDNARP